MARPKRVFSGREIRLIGLYALNGGKNQTIANAMDMSVNTLKHRFMKLLQISRAKRKLKLAHNQTKASKTSVDMQKFLGQNELGQTTKQVIETKAPPAQVSDTEREAVEAAAKEYKLKLTR